MPSFVTGHRGFEDSAPATRSTSSSRFHVQDQPLEPSGDAGRLLAELPVNGRRLPAADLPADLTMAELLLQHKLNCEDY